MKEEKEEDRLEEEREVEEMEMGGRVSKNDLFVWPHFLMEY